MSGITVAITDDHRVVARSLKAYLESFPDFGEIRLAANGEELLALLRTWRPQVVLQDLLMPGGIDGVETIRRVSALAPEVKIVALTASIDEARMMGALRAGASAYVRKDSEPETLLAAIRAVVRGKTYIDPSAHAMLVRAPGMLEALTPRETGVLRQLALGRSNKEIASALAISDETVKTHAARVMAKLQAENRAQAIVQALKRGLLTLEEIE